MCWKRLDGSGFTVIDTDPFDDHIDSSKTGSADNKYLSTTDPDASVQRQGGGRSKLKYKVHRGVDGKHEIITATSVATGSVNEAHLLKPLLLEHEKTTGLKAQTCVADSKYGIIANYLVLVVRRISSKRHERQEDLYHSNPECDRSISKNLLQIQRYFLLFPCG